MPKFRSLSAVFCRGIFCFTVCEFFFRERKIVRDVSSLPFCANIKTPTAVLNRLAFILFYLGGRGGIGAGAGGGGVAGRKIGL